MVSGAGSGRGMGRIVEGGTPHRREVSETSEGGMLLLDDLG